MPKGFRGFQKGHILCNGRIPWNKGSVGIYSIKQIQKLKSAGKIAALKRWKGHIAKPKKVKQNLWTISHDPFTQLQKHRFRNQRYKANKKGAEGNHTLTEWLELKHKYNNMCLCCKQFEPNIKLTEDHIVPLSLGGSDNIDNIQPLCGSCNSRKFTQVISYLPSSYNSLIYAEKGLVKPNGSTIIRGLSRGFKRDSFAIY